MFNIYIYIYLYILTVIYSSKIDVIRKIDSKKLSSIFTRQLKVHHILYFFRYQISLINIQQNRNVFPRAFNKE